MIFFKFNLISFTVTILAVLIIPAYSDINYEENCKYILMEYAGFRDQLIYDRDMNKHYKTTMANAQAAVKIAAGAKIYSIYIDLGIFQSDVFRITDARIPKIIENLAEGYYSSLRNGLQYIGNGTVTEYCKQICGVPDDEKKINYTIIRDRPFVYKKN